MASGTHFVPVRWTLAKTALITISPFLLVCHSDIWSPLESVSVQSQFPVVPESIIFFFPVQFLVEGCWCICGRLGERLIVLFFGGVSKSFLKGTQLPLHSRDNGSVNWLNSGDWMRNCDSSLWFKLDFCSLKLELFYSYRSNKNLVGFLILHSS